MNNENTLVAAWLAQLNNILKVDGRGAEMMKKVLNEEQFQRSAEFVRSKGRPLEVARLRFHFEGAPAAEVVRELAKFQNVDGGFGHALEPDLRAPESSALATMTALQVLREISGSESQMTSAVVRYLLNTYDERGQRWRIIPPTAGDSPHAPWWTQSRLEEAFNGCVLNPTAELLGALYTYGNDVSETVRGPLANAIVDRLSVAESITMHDFLACKQLVEMDEVPESLQQWVFDELLRMHDTVVAVDPSQWGGYCLMPLQVAESPRSPWYEHLHHVIPQNLDQIIVEQQEDGSWLVPWSWGGAYPDAWERAHEEWQGIVTLLNLVVLNRYERIER